MKRTLLYTILPADQGQTVEQILRRHWGLSTKAIRRAKFLEEGLILDGRRVFSNHPVTPGQVLSFNLQQDGDSSETIVAVPGPVNIVYEDTDLLIVNKGRCTPVHPSLGHYDDTLANYLVYHYAQRGENFTFRAVNRLDSNTSGLMIVAKNGHAHKQLITQLHTRQLVRIYVALVEGCPNPLCGTVSAPIRRLSPTKLLRIVAQDGQPAITHYKTMKIGKIYSLVEATLGTGRTHQIRVHMAHIGCPVVGDFLYGTEDTNLIQGHCLHAKSLTFAHPLTGEKMEFQSDLPQDMQVLINSMNQDLRPARA